MDTILWVIPSDGVQHEVVLEHDYWFGTKKICVDGETVFSQRYKINDWGLRQRVTIGSVEGDVIIQATPWATFRYRLSIDGEIQPPAHSSNRFHWFTPWRWPPYAWLYAGLGLILLGIIHKTLIGRWPIEYLVLWIDRWIAPG